MPDAVAPQLPDTAPIDLREFIECKRASVTISNGELTWLPLPPEIRDLAPTPSLDLQPGASPGTGTMSVGFGPFLSVSIGVSISDGQLHMDAAGAGAAIPGAQEAIDDWVRRFNEWLKRNDRRLKDTSIAGGSVTLTKEPIPATAPPPTPPPPPPTPTPPIVPTTPSGGVGGGCALFGLLGLVLVGALGVGVATGFIDLPGGVTPSAAPSVAPSIAASVSPSVAPSVAPSIAPSVAPSIAPSVAPSAEPTPPKGTEPALAFLDEYGLLPGQRWPELPWTYDPSSDWYLPQPGVVPVQDPKEIDHTSATGFETTLTPDQATVLSKHMPCEKEATGSGGTSYRAACNQPGPLVAGDYYVIITTFAGPYPSDVPAAGLHSWSVFTDSDNDLTTGYQSSASDNYLIGAERYFELLAFESNDGTWRNYILATDPAAPPRADTGATQGNLPTRGRVAWFQDPGVIVWIIPVDDFGPNWGAGAFSTTDRGANSPETLAADSLGGPASEDDIIFSRWFSFAGP